MACCAFNGHISEIPNISVDNFTNRNVQAYFLSHTHTDHTPGLYDHRFIQTLKTNGAVMYMSEMSAAIVKYEVKCRLGSYDTDEIVKRIRIVGIETIEVLLKADPKRRQRASKLYVTAVPAAHSIGSVMFLFKTDFTTVLYTGDFRISVNDVPKFNQLHDNGAPIPIDTLYVDTTFLDDRYTTFPKRSVSVDAALREMERWLKEKGRVAIKTSAKFGYEFVFNEVFKKLGVKVFVEEVRWKELYSHIPHLVFGVTNNQSPVHLCWPKNRKDHTHCTPDPADHKYLNIHLSAQKWIHYDTEDNPINKVSENEIDVCFSTHCSKSELMYFVNYFKPKKVVGFPNKFLSEVKCEVLSKKAKFEDGKLDKKVLREIFDI
ncbi:protein artemis-like [Cydia amplana]|uniref:protein artemis-like n=1 Tax=Cydia amplana TaxID=1869771 RepID=UPI002FE626F9